MVRSTYQTPVSGDLRHPCQLLLVRREPPVGVEDVVQPEPPRQGTWLPEVLVREVPSDVLPGLDTPPPHPRPTTPRDGSRGDSERGTGGFLSLGFGPRRPRTRRGPCHPEDRLHVPTTVDLPRRGGCKRVSQRDRHPCFRNTPSCGTFVKSLHPLLGSSGSLRGLVCGNRSCRPRRGSVDLRRPPATEIFSYLLGQDRHSARGWDG